MNDLAFECADCNAGEPEQCMKATHCPHRDGPQCNVLDEDWLCDVISDSLELDWTPRDGARAIIRALNKTGAKQDDAGVDSVAVSAVVGADQQAGQMVNENADLRGKLRSVISHATGGSFHDENASLNTICVEITRVRNHIYEAGRLANAGTEWEALKRAVDDDLLLIEMLGLGDFPTRDFSDRLIGAARRLRAFVSAAALHSTALESKAPITAIQAEIDKPLQGSTHGAWDRGRIAGLRDALRIIRALSPALDNTAVEGQEAISDAVHSALWNADAENKRLREALQPFANAADRLTHYGDIDDRYEGTNHRLFASRTGSHLLELLDGVDGDPLTIGHLTEARAVLTLPTGAVSNAEEIGQNPQKSAPNGGADGSEEIGAVQTEKA